MFARILPVPPLCTHFTNWRIISRLIVWLGIEQVDFHDHMNRSNTKASPTLLAGILYKMARHGYEAELKPDRFHMHLILGHIQPLPPEIIVTLRENGFEYCFFDKTTYIDADGATRCRSHFRRPH